MAKINDVVARITVKASSEGLDKLTGDLGKFAAANENVAVVSEKSAKSMLSVEAAWKRSVLRLDDAARAQDNIARATKIADAALAQGLATQEQYARQLGLINDRYGQVSASSKQMIAGMTAAGDSGAVASNKMIAGMSVGAAAVATGAGLARHELINLGRQAQDVGVSLLSGQSPFTVLAQQGTQIADVFISSGKSIGSFFSQAIGWAGRFFTSTAGIVTGIAAIGIAAVYAASQFVRASTTVEQALENQNRLLKEGKALLDQRTSAEARAQLNPKDLTEYEIKRNLLDVQRKLNEEARNALIRTAPRPNIGGDIRGEFAGEAPLTPGMEKVIDATVKLKEAQAAGLPGMKEYNAELGRIATAHPELAKTVDKMIELGRAGIELENAEMRLRAISDALKGIATDAQMAAVGLGSVAQFKLSNLQATEAAAATERQAKATLQMAQLYPGMSIEGAKMLHGAEQQLELARAGVQMEQIEIEHKQRSAELTDKMGAAEGNRIASMERAAKLAQIEAQHQQTMVQLRGQLDVASQVTGIGQINAQYEATVANLEKQIGLSRAIEQAEMQRAIAIATVNTEADRTLHKLRGQAALLAEASKGEQSPKVPAPEERKPDERCDLPAAA